MTTKNVQLVTEGEVFQFQNRPTAESAGKNRDDGTHELKHAENTTAAHPKTLDFSAVSEFLVATGNPCRDQRWSTFLKNHAAAIIACDFCVVASATFRILYVFVVIEHASRRIVHLNVTAHPTAAWTLQQLREAIPSDHTYRFMLHERDTIFSTGVDASVAEMGLEVIKTPVRSPKANSLCERLIGTLRRECLDWIIPLTEEQIRKALRS